MPRESSGWLNSNLVFLCWFMLRSMEHFFSYFSDNRFLSGLAVLTHLTRYGLVRVFGRRNWSDPAGFPTGLGPMQTRLGNSQEQPRYFTCWGLARHSMPLSSFGLFLRHRVTIARVYTKQSYRNYFERAVMAIVCISIAKHEQVIHQSTSRLLSSHFLQRATIGYHRVPPCDTLLLNQSHHNEPENELGTSSLLLICCYVPSKWRFFSWDYPVLRLL